MSSPQTAVEKVKAWLGEQSKVMQACLDADVPLDALIVYTSKKCAIRKAIQKRHGKAISLGLQWGQDFSKKEHRMLCLALLLLLWVRHLWISWPCTAFCSFVALNLLKGFDLTDVTSKGLQFLQHTAELFYVQKGQQEADQRTRHSHGENPWRSRSFREKAMKLIMAVKGWFGKAQLAQCRTNLRGPGGGLHWKLTAIISTSIAMLAAFSLTCRCVQPHEVVRGAATELSEIYTDEFGEIAAEIMMMGGESSLSASTRVGSTGANMQCVAAQHQEGAWICEECDATLCFACRGSRVRTPASPSM